MGSSGGVTNGVGVAERVGGDDGMGMASVTVRTLRLCARRTVVTTERRFTSEFTLGKYQEKEAAVPRQ